MHSTTKHPGAGPSSSASAAERSPLRAVALPTEHGGWGLTLEPVLLGLLLTASWAGLFVGVAAFGAFLLRTPAKLVAVDLRRGRWLARTRRALAVAMVETIVVVSAVVAATALAGWAWWIAVLVAAPVVVVEAQFEIRSKGRRLVPELCGALGVAGAAAAIVVAGGGSARMAAAAWLVLAARSIGAIPFVRAQIMRARRGITTTRSSDVAQAASVTTGVVAVIVDGHAVVAAAAIVVIATGQSVWVRREPPAIKVVGLRQLAIGLALVTVTGFTLA